MRVHFDGHHVAGDFTSGRLTVHISARGSGQRPAHGDLVWFTVPVDFRCDNVSVAAALLTLFGRVFPVVTFDSPYRAAAGRPWRGTTG